jgi:carboxyl-terminal processing protease
MAERSRPGELDVILRDRLDAGRTSHEDSATGREYRALRHGTVSLIALSIFLAGLLTGQGLGPMRSGFGAAPSLQDQPAFATLEEAWQMLHEHYVLPEELDESDLIYGAARGMLQAAGDPGHTAFLDPVEARSFRSSLEGQLIGVGLRLDFGRVHPTVVAPIPNSPAEAAGIEAGDQIVSIDGVPTDRMSMTDIASSLRGEEGEAVTLGIIDGAEGSVREVTLVRARIPIEPVEWLLLPDDLMLIRLSQFSAGAGEDLREALRAGFEAGVEGVVLDLRGNPGGLVSEAIRVGSEFLPEGTTLYMSQGRDGEPVPVPTTGTRGVGYDVPLVVLVDSTSASAAEIIAAAMRDAGRAEVVGERTFGTGTVVSSYALQDGSIAAIGSALWLTPEGELLRTTGVDPTIAVMNDPDVVPIEFAGRTALSLADIEQARDEQLLVAMEVLFDPPATPAAVAPA